MTLNSFNCFRVKPAILWSLKEQYVYVRKIFNVIVMLELPILHI